MKHFRFLFIAFGLLLFSLVSNPLFSQIPESEIKSSLPGMLGANNAGTEFYFTIPPCFEDESGGAENFIKIYITSAVATQVVVEVEGSGYYNTRKTIANDIIEFNITPAQGQAYKKAGRDPNVPEAIFPGKGIHIYAEQPMVVYCVVRYKYTSDGFLCIPVSSLGKEYIVAGWNSDAMFRAVWNYKLPNMCGIVAAYDDTRVRFTLGGNLMTKTAGGMTPGQSKEVVLRKGDVWMFSTDTDEADLSGSKIIANKPVAVVTGNMCSNIPSGNQWCDYTAEMDIPTFTWGTDYHVPKVPNRKYSSIIRIFAKEPNTSYYRDGVKLGEILKSGGIEKEAYITMRMVDFEEKPRSIVISGDKPIGVTLYNTGVQEDGAPLPNSDPFVMALTPIQQYQNEITFCTPGIMGGMGFPENYINLVYETDSTGYAPDDMEFATVVSGKFKWSNLANKFPGGIEKFTYDIQGKKYALKTITLPQDGVYKIRAKKPFAAYSFGYSYMDSYGYPTSAALADQEKQDLFSPKPSYYIHCDGSVSGGIVTDMPDDNKVRSNLSMLIMDDLQSENYLFRYTPFIAGETRTTTWQLDVIDPTKDAKATLTFTDRRGNDTSIIINYDANVLMSVIPPTYKFTTPVIDKKIFRQDFWLRNNSSTAPKKIIDIKLLNDKNKFAIEDLPSMPLELNPSDSIKFVVAFDPSQSGNYTDAIVVEDSCGKYNLSYLDVRVTSLGIPIILCEDVDFGEVKINTTSTKLFKISNRGTSDLSLDSIKRPTSAAFDILFTPTIIPMGGETVFGVTFKPIDVRDFNDLLYFYSNAPNNNSKNFVVLKGSGIPATDVEDSKNKMIELFPNPADTEINIKSELPLLSIIICDEKGRIYNTIDNINSTDYQIKTEALALGSYILKIKLANGNDLVRSIIILR